MERSKIFWVGTRLLKNSFRIVRPLEISAQIWNSCDQRCLYCRCPEVQTSLLTTDQWRGIIRQLGAMGTLRIKFQGGEPTLRPDFLKLCLEARTAGMITATITNGISIACRPDLLDGLDEVVISLDSIRKEVNDTLRGEGAYEGALEAINHSLARGLKTYINMALTGKNLEDLEMMLEFCERKGMKMNAQPIKFGTEYYDDHARSIALSSQQIRDLHFRLADWKKSGRAVMFSTAAYLKPTHWADLNRNTAPCQGDSKCVAGRNYFHINPNGDVIPCIPFDSRDFAPFNILKQGLYEALRHTRSHHCGDCWSAYLNERKKLFRFHPAALREYVRRG